MEHESNLVLTENTCRDFQFNWVIPNIKNIPGGKLKSALPTSDKCNLKLYLILKVTPGPAQKLKIGLSKSNFEPHDSCVLFHFKFLNFRGEIFCRDTIEFKFSENAEMFSREITKPSAVSEPNSVRHLYVSVKGHVVVKQCYESVATDPDTKDEAVTQLQQDFKEILQSGEVADIIVEAGNGQFKVHKFILYARSGVFRKMFTNDMSESRLNRIRIDDMNSAVFKEFLTFLYTGEIGTLTFNAARELYSAGDKYEVLTLQKRCRGILISYSSDSTISSILKLADMHNDRELEELAVKFICENFKTVSENAGWKTLIFDSPLLVSRTLQKVSNRMSILM